MKLLSIYNFLQEEAGETWSIDAWELEVGQRYSIEAKGRAVLRSLYPLICQKITAPAGTRLFFHQKLFCQYDLEWIERGLRTAKTLKLWLNLEKEPYLAWLKVSKLELLRQFDLYSFQFHQPHQLPAELLAGFALVSFLCQETGLICIESCQQQSWSKDQLFFWQELIQKSPACLLLQDAGPRAVGRDGLDNPAPHKPEPNETALNEPESSQLASGEAYAPTPPASKEGWQVLKLRA